MLELLQEPIFTSSVYFTDIEGNYYLYLSVSRDVLNKAPYEVWLLNGKVITNVFGDSNNVY